MQLTVVWWRRWLSWRNGTLWHHRGTACLLATRRLFRSPRTESSVTPATAELWLDLTAGRGRGLSAWCVRGSRRRGYLINHAFWGSTNQHSCSYHRPVNPLSPPTEMDLTSDLRPDSASVARLHFSSYFCFACFLFKHLTKRLTSYPVSFWYFLLRARNFPANNCTSLL